MGSPSRAVMRSAGRERPRATAPAVLVSMSLVHTQPRAAGLEHQYTEYVSIVHWRRESDIEPSLSVLVMKDCSENRP